MVIKAANSHSIIEYLPPLKEGDMTRRQPDISKMKSALCRELMPIEDGFDVLIAQYIAKGKK